MVTFFETTLLVVLVIFLFLQNWRAVIIPCITIPVSLIGTLAIMSLFGFSINTLTLFGLILAVAIVVDDAIVVVENSTRLLDTGRYTARQAVTEAMGEITGPIVGSSAGIACRIYPYHACQRDFGTIVQAVCLDHCCQYRAKRHQLTDADARTLRIDAPAYQTLEIPSV